MTSYRDQQGRISVALCKGHCDADVTVTTCWDLTENFAFRTITSTVTRIQPVVKSLVIYGYLQSFADLSEIDCSLSKLVCDSLETEKLVTQRLRVLHFQPLGNHEQWKKISSVTRQPLMKYAWCYCNNMCINLIHKAIYSEVGVCCQWSPVLLTLSGKNEQ